jgi:hypothetical protein
MRANADVCAMLQISTGEEGYMSGGSGWLDNGSKGMDFAANIRDSNIAFATIHLCARPPPPNLCP